MIVQVMHILEYGVPYPNCDEDNYYHMPTLAKQLQGWLPKSLGFCPHCMTFLLKTSFSLLEAGLGKVVCMGCLRLQAPKRNMDQLREGCPGYNFVEIYQEDHGIGSEVEKQETPKLHVCDLTWHYPLCGCNGHGQVLANGVLCEEEPDSKGACYY